MPLPVPDINVDDDFIRAVSDRADELFLEHSGIWTWTNALTRAFEEQVDHALKEAP